MSARLDAIIASYDGPAHIFGLPASRTGIPCFHCDLIEYARELESRLNAPSEIGPSREGVVPGAWVLRIAWNERGLVRAVAHEEDRPAATFNSWESDPDKPEGYLRLQVPGGHEVLVRRSP